MENVIKVLVVAGVVLEKDGKFLLVQEGKPEVRGLWNVPAGRVENGYTIKETAIKEAKEESGFDVELLEEIAILHKDGDEAVKHIFKAKIIGGEINFPEGEILDVRWFSLEEIESMKDQLRREWVLEVIRKVAN